MGAAVGLRCFGQLLDDGQHPRFARARDVPGAEWPAIVAAMACWGELTICSAATNPGEFQRERGDLPPIFAGLAPADGLFLDKFEVFCQWSGKRSSLTGQHKCHIPLM